MENKIKSASIIEPAYRKVLAEARAMRPGFTDAVALVIYIEVQNLIIRSAITVSTETDRFFTAVINKSWALELYNVIEERKN